MRTVVGHNGRKGVKLSQALGTFLTNDVKIIVVRVDKEYINDIHFKNTFNLAEIIFAYEIHHSQNIKPIALFNYDISYKNKNAGPN